ncbi:MAG: YitT family protein [Clostridia bacterium]|nr:YitT family protein [Clostridia bacterium]MBO7178427.1 YitT family protein [Clostridia bacterium]
MKLDKKVIFKEVWYYFLLAIFAFLRAIAIYVFIVPNAFAPGGVGGIASILYNFVATYDVELADKWFDPGVWLFIMNIPLIIAALFKLEKRYSITTCVCVLMYSGFTWLLSFLDFPTFQGAGLDSGVTMLAAIAGGVIGGVSFGGMLLLNTGAGGTEIIAKITYEAKPDMNIQWQLFACDSFVVILSGVLGAVQAKNGTPDEIFVGIATPVLYSFITLFLTSQVAEILTNGVQSSVVFHIVTDKKEEVREAIVNGVRRGGSIIKTEGTYSREEHNMIICVVRKKQTTSFKKLLKEIDPNAFIYITKAKEVSGLFRTGN